MRVYNDLGTGIGLLLRSLEIEVSLAASLQMTGAVWRARREDQAIGGIHLEHVAELVVGLLVCEQDPVRRMLEERPILVAEALWKQAVVDFVSEFKRKTEEVESGTT